MAKISFGFIESGYPDRPFGRGSSRGCPETADFSGIPKWETGTDS
jgi:hypothetical protein